MHNTLKKIVFIFIGLSLALMFYGCERPAPTQTAHFNIDSLITSQVIDLSALHASLTKAGTINAVKQDTVLTALDTAAWRRELDIFSEIELFNKPAYRVSYEVNDGLRDASSNLTIRAFQTTEDLPVRYVKLFYLDNLTKLRKIEALYQQDNALMKTQRKLVMEFSDVYNKNILTSYSVEGGQKMFAGDSVHFVINGTVTFN
jgi:hypothetical protein